MTFIFHGLLQGPLTLRALLGVVPAELELGPPYEVVGGELGLDHPHAGQHEQHPGPRGHEQVVLEVLEVVFLVGQPDQERGHVRRHLRRGGRRAVRLLQHAVVQWTWHHDRACSCIWVEVSSSVSSSLRWFLHFIRTQEREHIIETCVEPGRIILNARRQSTVVSLNCGVFVNIVGFNRVLAGQLSQIPPSIVATVAEFVRQPLGECLGPHVSFQLLGGQQPLFQLLEPHV